MPTIRDIIRKTCEDNGHPEFCDEISYVWSNKMTRTFGRATFQNKRIKISRKTWERASFEERAQLVAHETCHLLAYWKFNYRQDEGTKFHGIIWQRCMLAAGYEPLRFHAIDYGRRNIENVAMYCGCQTHYVSKNLRTRIVNGTGRYYVCRTCKQPLKTNKNKVGA